MQDRLSTYPGRIKLTPVVGQENVYDVERMDEPSQLGTELKTETLLSDATAELLGLDNTATPNTAFAQLKSLLDAVEGKVPQIAVGSYKGTGKVGSSNPNSLTFAFEPRAIFMLSLPSGLYPAYNHDRLPVTALSTTYKQGFGFGENSQNTNPLYAKVSTDRKTVYWYNGGNSPSASYQANASRTTYYYIAIG